MTEEERYFERVEEFDQLISIAWTSAKALATTKVETDGQSYASILHDKLFAHACSLSRLLPRRTPTTGLIWDISSVSAIARCMMEAYSTLEYLALDNIGAEERDFRIKLLALHDCDRRLQTAKALGSSQATMEMLSNQFNEHQENVSKCEFFASLSAKEQDRMLREPRDFYKSRKERNAAANVDDDFYHTALIYLSQFVHSHGFALHQLHRFSANTPEAYRAMGIPVAFATAFFAKGIQGMRRLFALDEGSLSPGQHEQLNQMATMTNGFPATPE